MHWVPIHSLSLATEPTIHYTDKETEVPWGEITWPRSAVQWVTLKGHGTGFVPKQLSLSSCPIPKYLSSKCIGNEGQFSAVTKHTYVKEAKKCRAKVHSFKKTTNAKFKNCRGWLLMGYKHALFCQKGSLTGSLKSGWGIFFMSFHSAFYLCSLPINYTEYHLINTSKNICS